MSHLESYSTRSSSFHLGSADGGITPVPLRTYQCRRRRVTSAPLWVWFWPQLFMSQLILLEDRVVHISFCSLFFVWVSLTVLIRSTLSSLILFHIALLSPVCLLPHQLYGETLLCKGLFKRLSLINKDIEYFWNKALLEFWLSIFDWLSWWWS